MIATAHIIRTLTAYHTARPFSPDGYYKNSAFHLIIALNGHFRHCTVKSQDHLIEIHTKIQTNCHFFTNNSLWRHLLCLFHLHF